MQRVRIKIYMIPVTVTDHISFRSRQRVAARVHRNEEHDENLRTQARSSQQSSGQIADSTEERHQSVKVKWGITDL